MGGVSWIRVWKAESKTKTPKKVGSSVRPKKGQKGSDTKNPVNNIGTGQPSCIKVLFTGVNEVTILKSLEGGEGGGE